MTSTSVLRVPSSPAATSTAHTAHPPPPQKTEILKKKKTKKPVPRNKTLETTRESSPLRSRTCSRHS